MFQPTAAVLCHSLVTVDAAVLALLKPEEALLIHRCVARADRRRRAWGNTAGREFLTVYDNEELIWDVQAGLLEQTGLGDYHPGRSLSATGLEWANGESLPFQFQMGNHGVFIYEGPSLDPPPGDLPGVSFRIRLQFGEFDDDGNPDTGGPEIIDDIELPAQDAEELSDTIKQALLADIFNGVDAFGSSPFTATLMEGENPSFTPVELAPWTNLDEPVSAYATRARNQSAIEWTETVTYERTITAIRYQRGPWTQDVALASPLTVAANTKVVAPINALALNLIWPWDDPAGFTVSGGTIAALTNIYTKAAHNLATGDPVRLLSLTGGTGLAAPGSYWFYRIDANAGKLCASRADALAGTAIDVTLDASSVELQFVGTDPLPSRTFLSYFAGGTREAAGLGSTLSIAAYDDTMDPIDTVSAIPANNTRWEIGAGLTVTPINIEGTNLATGGNWITAVVEVLSGSQIIFRERHPQFVAEGDALVFNGGPVFSLNASPS